MPQKSVEDRARTKQGDRALNLLTCLSGFPAPLQCLANDLRIGVSDVCNTIQYLRDMGWEIEVRNCSARLSRERQISEALAVGSEYYDRYLEVDPSVN